MIFRIFCNFSQFSGRYHGSITVLISECGITHTYVVYLELSIIHSAANLPKQSYSVQFFPLQAPELMAAVSFIL